MNSLVMTRDLRYVSIRQYINTVIEYRIVILCFKSIDRAITK